MLLFGGNLVIFAAKTSIMDYNKKYQRRLPRCLECGDKIYYGRSDKKFCSEECRTKHHNHLARSGKGARRRVIAALDRNYSILEGLLDSGVKTISLREAASIGFNPEFLTAFSKRGVHREYFCFDITYRMSQDRLTRITKLQNVSVSLQDVNNENIE